MIGISVKGDSNKTSKALMKMKRADLFSNLDRYGAMGVKALASMTPVDSGLTQQSWAYRIVRDSRHIGIEWYNTNKVNGTPIAVLIQYGHGTGTGGYIQGRDYINPAMRPVFDNISNEIWKKVRSIG